MRLLKKLNNKEGSSLVVVIVCFAVLMILGTSLITISAYSHNNSAYYHRQQQAQYTAEGVIKTLTDSFADPNNSDQLITAAKLATAAAPLKGSGDLSVNNMGTYTVELSYDASATPRPLIRAEVLSNYQGSSYKLSAYYKEGKGDRLNPLDFVMMNRSTFINVDGTPTNKTVIDGKFFTRGLLYSANAYFNNKVLLVGSGVVGGNTTFKESVIIKGSCNLSGIAASDVEKGGFYDGNVSSTNPSVVSKFISTVPIGIENVILTAFRKWSAIHVAKDPVTSVFTINDLVYDWNVGAVTAAPAGTVESGGVYTMPNGDSFDISSLIFTAANGETADITNFTYVVYEKTDPSSFPTISLSGTITEGQYQLDDFAGSVPATLNTTAGDIHLYATGDLKVGGDVNITGENNVYIHIPDGHTLTVKQNRYLGKSTKNEHQLFIVADNANVALENNSTLKGSVYLHTGIFTDVGLRPGSPKVYGSISATTITIQPGNIYKYVDYYKEPECNATMVDDTIPLFISPKNNTGVKDWLFYKYDK